MNYRNSRIPITVSSIHNENDCRQSQGPPRLKQERSLTMSLFAASLILSTFASERPLTLQRALLVVICIPLMVQIPTDFSFLMSATFWKSKNGCSRLIKCQPTSLPYYVMYFCIHLLYDDTNFIQAARWNPPTM